MNSSLRYITAILALLATTLGAGLQEFVHHDVVNAQTAKEESIASHTCGAIEHHIPLDAVGVCSICTYSKQSNVENEQLQTAPLSVLAIAPIARVVHRPNMAEFPQCNKRGPPPTFT